MKTLTTIAALILMTLTMANAADKASVGDLTVSKAWARASIGAKRPGGAFVTISNSGSSADQLIAVQTPAAGKSELHSHTMADGIMKMGQVKSVDIPAGGMTMLKPGSFHIMMFNLKAALNEGDMFPLTLTFKKAGKASVMVHVGKVGGMAAPGHGAHSPQHMKSMDHKKHMQDEGHKKMHDMHINEGTTEAQ